MTAPTGAVRFATAAAIAFAIAGGEAVQASLGAQSSLQAKAGSGAPVAILFLCKDGATESVLAAAYLQRLATDRGLAVRVEAAGVEPRARVASAVVQYLKKSGYAFAIDKPRQATARDVEAADVIVSIGANVTLLRPRGVLKEWQGVPDLNVSFDRAVEAIRERVGQLLEELSRPREGQ